jgi:hypothetical protein
MNVDDFILSPSGNIEIVLDDGTVVDLHNSCEFIGIYYVLVERKLSLKWHWYKEYDEDGWVPLSMIFDEVSSWSITPRDPEMPFSEDDTLDHFEMLDGGSGVGFFFHGGMVLEVKAAKSAFVVSER